MPEPGPEITSLQHTRTVAVFHKNSRKGEDSRVAGVLGGFTRLPAGTGIVAIASVAMRFCPAGEPLWGITLVPGQPWAGHTCLYQDCRKTGDSSPPQTWHPFCVVGLECGPPSKPGVLVVCHRLTMVFRWSCQRLLWSGTLL